MRRIRMMMTIALGLLVALLVRVGPAPAATVSLAPTQDTWIQEDLPTRNNGADTANDVKSQSSAVRRTLIQFDLSSIPACATVTAATLRMHVDTNSRTSDDKTHAVHRLTAPWTESGATWLLRDGGTPWLLPGADFVAPTATATAPGGAGWTIDWNLTSDVLAFRAGTATNYGWLVKDANEGVSPASTVGYAARTSTTPANQPVLLVTVTLNDAVCDDANPCTADTCNAASGCQNIALTSGTPCPDDGSPCTSDVCNGSGTCTHAPGNAGVVCRGAAGPCDAVETCDGTSAACPPDALLNAGSVCRGVAGPCDVAEVCDGASPLCPSDAKSYGVCRASAGACDVAESCDGVSNACPPDGFQPGTVECRAAAGPCDVAELCTGSSAACPADGFLSSATECRASAGVCDPAEHCTGTAAACPSDAKSTATCRAAAGPCDLAESCDGVSNGCPPDAFRATGFACRPANGVCDLAETCDGVSAACPADARSTAVCRPAAGLCDVAESCDGVSRDCPTDAFLPSGTECRASTDPCDLAETCTGTAAACPPDSGFVDGDGDGVCDGLDRCPSVADPDQADTDGDGVGDACDPCTNVDGHAITGQKITVAHLAVPVGDERLKFKGDFSVPYPFDPPLDPMTKGIRAVVAGATGRTILDVVIPGGAFDEATQKGWKVNALGTAFTYRHSGHVVPLIGGIKRVVVKNLSARIPGRLRFVVVGKNGSWPVDAADLPLRGTFVVDAPRALGGQCAEATFPGPPPLVPACVLTPDVSLTCK